MTLPRPQQHPAVLGGVGRNVIAVASGKGGVGKTFLSITLAHALARAGRRALLFDGDLGLANVDIQLGLEASRDLGAVTVGRMGLRDAVTRFEEGGFDVVAGKSGSGALASLDPGRRAALTQELWALAPSYDRVILDLGAGVDAPMRALTPPAGATLVVATDEPTSLTDAYAYIKLTVMERRDADLRIVVNLAASLREGEKTYATLSKACRTFLKFTPPLAGVVRRDDRVRDSIRRQTALLTRHPASDAARDIEAIATGLC
jgi:flagellar biosynthesis protein FlhG